MYEFYLIAVSSIYVNIICMALKKPSILHGAMKLQRFLLFLFMFVLLTVLLASGCTSSEEDTLTSITTTVSTQETVEPYMRMEIDTYKGISEPRSANWDFLLVDTERLLQSGFNTLALEPPVLITERAGGQPRAILEGAAVTIPGLIDSIHEEGLAVFLAPTTASPGFAEAVAVDDITLERITEDTLEWAEAAEEKQVELFAPLSRCNLVLGTDACRTWMQEVLPATRAKFTGPIAAKVVADIEQTPVSGGQHDFELLDYRGYDFIMVGIHPWGHIYNEERFRLYVTDVLDRAVAIAERDGLQGVIIGDLRLPRNNDQGLKLETGTWLNEEQQAEVTDMVIDLSMPKASGFFYYGWSLDGYGARGYPVEDTLARWFGLQVAADVDTNTNGSTEDEIIIENS